MPAKAVHVVGATGGRPAIHVCSNRGCREERATAGRPYDLRRFAHFAPYPESPPASVGTSSGTKP